MIRIIVDSGSSIKQDERKKYGVDILPLRYLLGEKEYDDGVDISIDEFYSYLIEKKYFPKTSLPNMELVKNMVEDYVSKGDEVLIITISSGISGTFSAISQMFEGNDKVRVVDSLSAVGGVKILVKEANKYRNKSLNEIVEKLNKIIPRIKILAIPETLNYLLRGGRLSKKEWLVGTVLNIKPIITLKQGIVKVQDKKIGIKNAMRYLVEGLEKFKCDLNFPIVPSYTYKDDNLKILVNMTNEKYKTNMTEFDNLDPVIGSHWGPNAFGFIFVSEE